MYINLFHKLSVWLDWWGWQSVTYVTVEVHGVNIGWVRYQQGYQRGYPFFLFLFTTFTIYSEFFKAMPSGMNSIVCSSRNINLKQLICKVVHIYIFFFWGGGYFSFAFNIHRVVLTVALMVNILTLAIKAPDIFICSTIPAIQTARLTSDYHKRWEYAKVYEHVLYQTQHLT